MPAERIAMRLVREVLRLITAEQLSVRETARRTGKAPSTVRATLGRLRAAGLSWPLPEELSDSELEERLYGKGGARPGPARRTEPDWASIHRELKRKHVTLSILWEEYIAQEPDGLRYSRFCELYRLFAAKLPVVMRHRTFHGLGELNQAIREMLADINGRRPLRRLGVTRQQLFEELDRPALKPLPAEPYVYTEWRIRRAGLDYHVEVEDHYYSVDQRLISKGLPSVGEFASAVRQGNTANYSF